MGKANALFAPLLRVTSTTLFPTEPVASLSTRTRNSILTHTAPAWTRSRSLPWQTFLLFKEPKPSGQGVGRPRTDRQTARPREVQRCRLPALCTPDTSPRPRRRGHRASSLSLLVRSADKEGGEKQPFVVPGRGGGIPGRRAGRG